MSTAVAETGQASRYAQLRDEFETQLAAARDDARAARTAQARHEAMERIDQFQQALAMVREAETIKPRTVAQFGTPASNWQFRIPPRLDEYRAVHPAYRAEAHRVVTDDPLVIAYLRQMVRSGRVPNLQEVKVGQYWVPARTAGADGRWVSPETYQDMIATGAVGAAVERT